MKRPLIFLHLTKKCSRYFFLLLLCLLLSLSSYAQSRSQLEKQRKKKEQEIALTKKLLAETNVKQRKTLDYLNVLNKQIKSRQELIGTLQNELHLIEIEIAREDDIVNALHNDLEALKSEYAKLMYFTYKNRNSNTLLSFIFSSNSFNEAIKRFKFIQFYTSYRNNQIILIKRVSESLKSKIQNLQSAQIEKTLVLESLNNQKIKLEGDQNEMQKVAQDLKGEQSQLLKELREQQRIASRLDKAIQDIIAREVKNKTTTSSSGKNEELMLTPEAQKLGQEFAGNRTKLPWPVERGYISEKFGSHDHPTIPNVKINCNGVRIRTTKGAQARSIFSGTVAGVVKIAGTYAVLINHGLYYTVYNNLSEVYVRKDEKVKAKDAIGLVAENLDNGQTEIELEIWQVNAGKSTEKLNPEQWLFRK